HRDHLPPHLDSTLGAQSSTPIFSLDIVAVTVGDGEDTKYYGLNVLFWETLTVETNCSRY
ncbi:hypothetical protein Moror_2244, partial [Moniliophthora roreri MCA 2997]